MRTRWTTFVAVAVLGGALIAPSTASASTTEAIADTGGMTLMLDGGPSPLDVFVTLDDVGHITEVTVGENEPVEGDDSHRVRFSDVDDTTRVSVQAKNHKLAADVKAGALADLLGTRVWSAPLFGSETATSVTFEVTGDGSGNPGLVVADGDVVTDPDVDVTVGEVKTEAEEDEAEASVTITFVKDGYTMTLKIQVSVEDDDDDDDEGFSAKLKIVLRGKDVQQLRRVDFADVEGPHTWDGHLCNGTPVSVEYTVGEGGEFTDIAVDAIKGYEVKEMPHGFSVKFDDSKAKVTVELKEKEDGTWDLKVRSKTTDKCNPSDDKNDDDSEDGGDDDHGRRDKDKKKDRDDDDDDDDDEKDED